MSWQFNFPVVFSQHSLVLARSVLVGGKDDHFYTAAELEKPQVVTQNLASGKSLLASATAAKQ